MSTKKSVIRLLGNDYQIESENSEEFIQKIQFYVDKRFTEIAERNSRLSTNMIAVITSLNIAEETIKLQDENKELSAQLSATVDMLSEKEFELKKVSEENESLKEQLQEAKIELARLEAKAERKY